MRLSKHFPSVFTNAVSQTASLVNYGHLCDWKNVLNEKRIKGVIRQRPRAVPKIITSVSLRVFYDFFNDSTLSVFGPLLKSVCVGVPIKVSSVFTDDIQRNRTMRRRRRHLALLLLAGLSHASIVDWKINEELDEGEMIFNIPHEIKLAREPTGYTFKVTSEI